MPTPPQFLRSMLDGASEASFVVLSTGSIWHMNSPARNLFHVVDGRASGVPISTYLSFSTSHAPNREILSLSWEDVTEPDMFVNNKITVEGIGMPAGGERCSVTISLVRVTINEAGDDPREETMSGQSSASDLNGRQNDNTYFCLYVQEVTPARLQIASLEGEVSRLSATKDAIIRASGQFLMIINNGGTIQSVSNGIAEVFGYDTRTMP